MSHTPEPPSARKGFWRDARTGGKEWGARIWAGPRHVYIAPDHLRTIADQLHDIADALEQEAT